MGFVRLGLVLLVCGACGGDSTRGVHTVHGELTVGGETSLFRPCGSDEHWYFAPLDNPETVPGWAAAQKAAVPRCPDGGTSCGFTAVYLEGVARVSGKGSYGHLGKYDREVELISLERSLSEAPPECALSSKPL
jgi:hypothetical protein